MARATSIIAVLAALLAVASAAPSPAGYNGVGASLFGPLRGGFAWGRFPWAPCTWDGTAFVCDPPAFFWGPFPARPSPLPVWTATTAPAGAAELGEVAALCRGVTVRGLVAAGSCSCGTDGAGNLEQVSFSGPVNINAAGAEAACGAGTLLPCNAWKCICTAGGAAATAAATANAYCV